MGRKYQVISGDGHLETPPDFVKFVPEKWKDRAPRLITLPDGGGDAWLMTPRRLPKSSATAASNARTFRPMRNAVAGPRSTSTTAAISSSSWTLPA